MWLFFSSLHVFVLFFQVKLSAISFCVMVWNCSVVWTQNLLMTEMCCHTEPTVTFSLPVPPLAVPTVLWWVLLWQKWPAVHILQLHSLCLCHRWLYQQSCGECCCDGNGLPYITYSYILSACTAAGCTNSPVVSVVLWQKWPAIQNIQLHSVCLHRRWLYQQSCGECCVVTEMACHTEHTATFCLPASPLVIPTVLWWVVLWQKWPTIQDLHPGLSWN